MSDRNLARLLEHPAIWRGRSAASIPTWSTGFATLDSALPGGGWPRAGLVEILTEHAGVGELRLLMPVLAHLSVQIPARWCAWVAPPMQPFAPALVAHGIALSRQLVVRADAPLWALEQVLSSGACEMALGWLRVATPRSLRRLQLATERGRTLGIVFRSWRCSREASPAALRLRVESVPRGVRITLLKSRGGARAPVELSWPSATASATA